MELSKERTILLCGRMFTPQELEDIQETVRLSTPKQIYVYPLVKEFREYLCHEEGWANE